MLNLTTIYKFLDEHDPQASINHLKIIRDMAPTTCDRLVKLYDDFLAEKENLIDDLLVELCENLLEDEIDQIQSY